VRLKQPWFDVFDPDGNVVATFRARDIEQATDKAKSDHELWTDIWKVYRRPDNAPEPEKKLSARAQIAKRFKEPKVTPAVAADNAKDSQQIQARIGEPQPAGGIDDWSAEFQRRVQDIQPDVAQNFQQPGSAPFGNQFSGQWQVVDGAGRELYRFSGAGNNQGDANRIASMWARENNYTDALDVLPVMI
jgi:hypothetical protein